MIKRGVMLLALLVMATSWMCTGETLGGRVRLDLLIDPQANDVSDAVALTGTLQLEYGIGEWAFRSMTTLNEDGWEDQTFSGSGVFGIATVSSTLNLDPAGGFDSWTSSLSLPIAGVQYAYRFVLMPDDLSVSIEASAGSDLVSAGVTVELGDPSGLPGCRLLFQEATVDLGFKFCCTEIASSIEFECTGFESASFSVGGIAIPSLPWLKLAAGVEFTVDEKKLTVSPSISYGASVCFDLYLDTVEDSSETYPTDWLVLEQVEVVGIGLQCDIGGVSFAAASYWGSGGGPSPLKGNYWEAYQIATTDTACCGPFGFEVTAFFLDGAATLFEVAFVEAEFSIAIGMQFTVAVGVDVDLAGVGLSELRVGFDIEI